MAEQGSDGLCNQHANEKYEELLGREKLELTGKEADSRLVEYKLFLFGANQLSMHYSFSASRYTF